VEVPVTSTVAGAAFYDIFPARRGARIMAEYAPVFKLRIVPGTVIKDDVDLNPVKDVE
jgi:hypothetical protein